MQLAHASRIAGQRAPLISVLANLNVTVAGAGCQAGPSFLLTCWCGTLSRPSFLSSPGKDAEKGNGGEGRCIQHHRAARSAAGGCSSHRPHRSFRSCSGLCSWVLPLPEPQLMVSAGEIPAPCGSTLACRRGAEQVGWEVTTITRHMLVLGWEEASRDLPRGKDRSWMHESTSPHCAELLR